MLVVQVHEQNHTLMHSFFPGQILEDLLNHQKIIFIKIIIFFFPWTVRPVLYMHKF